MRLDEQSLILPKTRLHRESSYQPYMRDIENFVYRYLGANILFLSVLIGRVQKNRGPPSKFEKSIVSTIFDLKNKCQKKKECEILYNNVYIKKVLKKCKDQIKKKYQDGTLFNDC